MGTRLYRVEKIEYADACTLGYGDETDKIWELMEDYASHNVENEFEIPVEVLENLINCNLDELDEDMDKEEKEKILKTINETAEYAIANLRADIKTEKEKGNDYILYKVF
jgi:hypothetical protein